MKFRIFLILLSFVLILASPDKTKAVDKNIFGLHLTQLQDLESAKTIINSSGGDWGWITLVIRLDQLDHNAWQNFFNQCRRHHLIPILRLATAMVGDNWQKPSTENINTLAYFLNSLNWPTTQRHLVLFNETNRANEWGGEVNIEEYAKTSIYAAKLFKQLDSNFTVLGPAFDLAAPDQPPKYVSAPSAYRQIFSSNPEYFQLLDGLASHSYPNHGFIGRPTDKGQHSITGYRWELDFLKSLGVAKNLPVYITETGWPHRQGQTNNNVYYTTATTSQFLKLAIQIWQSDPQVKAATPFIYNYPYPPFDHFSWLDQKEKLYPEYQLLIDLPKNQNQPAQKTSFDQKSPRLPFIIFANQIQSGKVVLKNTGESIWGESPFCLAPKPSENIRLDPLCLQKDIKIEPGNSYQFEFSFTVNPSPGQSSYISWENLKTRYEISPLNSSATIYQPNDNFLQKLLKNFRKLFYQKFSTVQDSTPQKKFNRLWRS